MNPEKRQQFLIKLVIAAVALYVGVNFVYEPLGKWWRARAKTITELRAQVNNGRMLINRQTGIRNHWEEMRTNSLPNNPPLTEQQVIKAFDTWSRDSGAALNGVMPQWKSDAEDYMTYNCRVEASGDLETLSRLLYDIENDPMALKLDSVELSSHDNTGQQLTLGLQISGLVLTPSVKQ